MKIETKYNIGDKVYYVNHYNDKIRKVKISSIGFLARDKLVSISYKSDDDCGDCYSYSSLLVFETKKEAKEFLIERHKKEIKEINNKIKVIK